jgi:ribosomal protein S18 acetylase RimI-like enzyme
VAADIPAVLALWGTSRSAASVTEDTPEAVAALLAQPGSELFLAWEGAALVGTLVVGWDGWRGNMYRLAVRPESRRRGIGSALVDTGHAHLKALGCRRVTALVGIDQDVAGSLWRSAGYSLDDRIDRFVRNL